MKRQQPVTKYLRVSGRLAPDNRLFLRPSYLSENPRDAINVDGSPFQVEIYGDSALLLCWGASIKEAKTEATAGNKVMAPYYHLRTKVPFHPQARRIVFRYKGIALHEIKVPANVPELGAKSIKAKITGERCVIKWDASHVEGLPLRYHVAMSADEGRNWIRLASRLATAELSVPKAMLAGGKKCRIRITAYDGVNTVSVEKQIPGAPSSRLIAQILVPDAGDTALQFSPVSLEAYAGILGRPGPVSDCRLRWSINGKPFAEGANVLWHWSKPGRYSLSLDAALNGLKAKSEVVVVVGGQGKRPVSKKRRVAIDSRKAD